MEELVLIKKDYEKALEDGNVTRLNNILDSLFSFSVTFPMLKSTGMVGLLKKTKHSKHENIKGDMKLIKKSSDLMAKWKKDVTMLLKKEQSEKAESLSPAASIESVTPSSTLSPSSPKVEEVKSEVVVVEKKSPRISRCVSETLTTQQIDSIINSTSILPVRSQFRKLLYNDIKESSTIQEYSLSSIAKTIERIEVALHNAYNNGNEITSEYRQRFRDYRYNLKKNVQLLHRVIEGDIPADRFVHMTSEEMMTEELRKEREKIAEERFESSQTNWMIINHLDKLGGGQKCKFCGSDKTTYTQKQTRSADEPMTIFHVCHSCGKRWRE